MEYLEHNLLHTANCSYSLLPTMSLSDAIKENTGTTFLTHINRLRIEYAKSQMSNNLSDNKIEAISLMSGFTSYRTFARVFKLETGLAPSEFYKMAQSTDIIEPQKLDEE